MALESGKTTVECNLPGSPGFEPKRADRLTVGPLGVSGAVDPIRTDDLLITSELLYQLSYNGNLVRRTSI